MSALPFHGLRVVALEQAVAAAFCSRQLADMGADVIAVIAFHLVVTPAAILLFVVISRKLQSDHSHMNCNL